MAKKRANGEGSIRKRSDGRWEGRYTVGYDENGKVNTAHTTNLVPFTVCMKGIELNNGKLADIAPTILQIMGLKQPEEMTGVSLIK